MPRPTAAQQRTDLLIALAVLVGALLSAVLSAVAGIWGPDQNHFVLAVGYAVLLAAALAVRRRWPATVALVVSAAYFAAVTFRIPEVFAGNIAMFVALFTVGAWLPDRRRAAIIRLAIIAAMFCWLFVTMFQDAVRPVSEAAEGLSRTGAFSPYVAMQLLNIAMNVLYFGAAYYFGDRAFAQRQSRAALEERTAELEHAQAVTSAQAVALDRVRIARELHDVVAHHVSLMGVQAGAARAVMPRDPAEAAQLLAGVESSARDALRELRQILETLRTPGTDDATDAAAELAALPALADEATSAGLPTTLTIVGEPVDVPGVVQVNLYRIAQEALTNARRHAGTGAAADMRLRYAEHVVELEVGNTGRAGGGTPGLGQLGMRERAAASGGTIEIGPRARGGYLVRARVPLGTAERADG